MTFGGNTLPFYLGRGWVSKSRPEPTTQGSRPRLDHSKQKLIDRNGGWISLNPDSSLRVPDKVFCVEVVGVCVPLAGLPINGPSDFELSSMNIDITFSVFV